MEVVTPGGPVARARDFAMPDPGTRQLGRLLEIHAELGSTNARALDLGAAGAAHGATVIAMRQTAGRGQRGRRWDSPAGAGLYASVLVRPTLPAELLPALTLVAGVAMHETLAARGAPLGFRWPNDLLCRARGPLYGRKVCGILVEASWDQARLEHAVIGVGLNLEAAERPPALARAAVSLAELRVAERAPADILASFLGALERGLDEAEGRGLGTCARAWTEHALGLGQRVAVDDGRRRVQGRLAGIGDDGAVQVETAEGLVSLLNGHVELPGVPETPKAF